MEVLNNQRRCRRGRPQPSPIRCCSPLLACLLAVVLPPLVSAQFCISFDNTWAGFVKTVRDSGGFALLCPFEISGDRCPLPDSEEEEEGFVVSDGTDYSIVCDPFQYGFDLESSCIINCPGRHFTVRTNSRLMLDRMTMIGSLDSSVKVQSQGEISVINSIFENNVLVGGNGGAISALGNSKLDLRYTVFKNNEAQNGGAVYNMGDAFVFMSSFMDNVGKIAGGAFYSGAGSDTEVLNSSFINNRAGFLGGAIYDRFNTEIKMEDNEGCGNGLLYPLFGNPFCNGVYVKVSRGQVVCVEFENECVAPTPAPTSTQAPSNTPSTVPSTTPTQAPTYSQALSNVPSAVPSSMPTEGSRAGEPTPSDPAIWVGSTGQPTSTDSDSPTNAPSPSPSELPSTSNGSWLGATGMPTSTMSDTPSDVPSPSPSDLPSASDGFWLGATGVPTSIVSDSPSDVPSDVPSELPSASDPPSVSPSPTPAPSSSVYPTSSVYPSAPPSEATTVAPNSTLNPTSEIPRTIPPRKLRRRKR